MQEKKSSIVSTCIACCICLVLLVIFLLFVFVFGAEEPVYQVQSEARDGESADTAAGSWPLLQMSMRYRRIRRWI